MKIKSKKIVIAMASILFGVTGVIIFFNYSSKNCFVTKHNNLSSISSMIETYTTDKSDVKLTIGVFKSDKSNYKLFGANSKELAPFEYEYEIGSISKTFTTSLLCKSIADGLVSLEDPISKYLPLDSDSFYPTILSLATHSSGYGEYPYDPLTLSEDKLEIINNTFYQKKLNIYQGINRADILNNLKKHLLKDKSYGWEYSNFGIAVIGTVLSEVHDTSFKLLAENFIKYDLGLTKTRLGNGTGNMNSYWTWNEDDIYYAAGGFVSTVTDMIKYGQMHLNDSPDYLALSHKTYKTFKEDGLSMGLGWIIDPEKGYIWHNGGTSSYTSFLGLDKDHGTVVVILSNYPAEDDSEEDDDLDILGFTLLDSLRGDHCDVNNVLPDLLQSE